MITIIKFVFSAIITLLFAVILKLIERRNLVNKEKLWWKIFCGLCFGFAAIFATEWGGIAINGASMNIRDTAPLTAALCFSPLSGIIAGFIGGIERFLCVYWGGGAYTRIGCSVACIFAGLLAALLSNSMFRKKTPRVLQAAYVALSCEVFHMLLIFFTNMDDTSTAFTFVKKCTSPMVFGNIIAISVIVFIIRRIERHMMTEDEKRYKEMRNKLKAREGLAILFQRALLILISVAFIGTTVFNSKVTESISNEDTFNLLKTSLTDLKQDVISLQSEYQDKNEFEKEIREWIENWHIGTSGGFVGFDNNLVCIDSTEYFGKSLNELKLIPDETKTGDMFETEMFGQKAYGSFVLVNDYLFIGYVPTEEAMHGAQISEYLTVLMELLVYAVLFILVYFMLKQCVIKEVDTINEGLYKISHGDLDVKVKVKSSKELEFLSNSINNTVSSLKRLKKESEERMEKDLNLAKLIQTSSCPNAYPAFPERKDIDIFARMDTAKEVGGDFYDYYFTGNNKFTFLIADVSGKGIPAAMFMMKGKSIIKGFADRGLSTNKILEETNHQLCSGNDAEMFITAWLGTIDLDTGVLRYTSAGHNPPLIKKKDGDYQYLKCKPGLVLAAMDGVSYEEYEVPFNKGDMIYLYTDGVTEANNKDDELYGEDRLFETLNRIKDFDCKHVCEYVKLDVDKFASGREQFDDITMLSFARTDEAYRNTIERYQGDNLLTVIATIENQQIVTDFIEKNFQDTDVDAKTIKEINVAIDEIYSNIANYAYGTHAGLVTVSCKVLQDPARLSITFIDNGKPYNPLENKDPNTTLSAEEREIGGLGVFMVKKMMDHVSYEYKDNRNYFTMEKNINI